jgi:hypothetical protein
MSDIKMKLVLLACMACLGYFIVSTASQLHAATERLEAVEARMSKVEAGSVRSMGEIVTVYPEDAYWLDAFKTMRKAEGVLQAASPEPDRGASVSLFNSIIILWLIFGEFRWWISYKKFEAISDCIKMLRERLNGR